MQWDLLFTYRAWALNSAFFERIYPVVMNMIRQGSPFSHLKALNPNTKPYHGIDPAVIESGGYYSVDVKAGTERAGEKYTAVIPVLGTLTKRGDLCSYGMTDYIQSIKNANANANVDSIVLAIESPGGTVDGTPEFAKAVRESAKPVVAFGDGLVASAAYWVASQAKAIVANADNYTDFGSIGTLYIYENWEKYIEKEVGDVRIIRAPQSNDKALVNPFEPLKEEQEKEIKEELKVITDFFIENVKNGRGEKLKGKDEEIFTGRVFNREKALQLGLIDDVGTLEDAINLASSLAADLQPVNNNVTKNSNSMFKKAFSYLFGGKAEDKPKDEELSAEELAELKAAEQKLAELNAQITGLQKNVNDLNAGIAVLEGNIAAKDAEIARLSAELAAAPAGKQTTVVGDSDRGPEYENTQKFETSVDREAADYKKQLETIN